MSDFVQDPDKCEKYARFTSHLVRWQFKVIYFTLFTTNLFVLFLASWIFIKGQEANDRFEQRGKERRKRLKLSIWGSILCILVSTTIVIMEAFCLLALQFCDGEDLISLYWSTWTMIQVGSLIAIVGIVLAMYHSLHNSKHPPWALALGTPVLVIAGLLHLFHVCTKRRVRQIKGSLKSSYDGESNMGPPMSQANTIQSPDLEADSPNEGELIGFTIEGGPIIQFTNMTSISPLPDCGEILGMSHGERPIVSFQKDSLRLNFGPGQPARGASQETKELGETAQRDA